MGGSCCETNGATSLEQVRVAGAPALTRLHVALAGQPNVGKSTIFNLLTGLNQHVGNWPGKTVEQKIGVSVQGSITLDIVDLPGTYSLTANSPEELIAREYLLTQRPDVIVAVGGGSVLDTAKAVAYELDLPLAIVPTIASTDAPCSREALQYTEDHRFDREIKLKRKGIFNSP